MLSRGIRWRGGLLRMRVSGDLDWLLKWCSYLVRALVYIDLCWVEADVVYGIVLYSHRKKYGNSNRSQYSRCDAIIKCNAWYLMLPGKKGQRPERLKIQL